MVGISRLEARSPRRGSTTGPELHDPRPRRPTYPFRLAPAALPAQHQACSAQRLLISTACRCPTSPSRATPRTTPLSAVCTPLGAPEREDDLTITRVVDPLGSLAVPR